MDKYKSKLNFNFQTNQLILKAVGVIDSFKGKWSIVEQSENDFLKALRKSATIESIGSSTRIENSKLTSVEIENLLKYLDITKLETNDKQEVVGYYDVLTNIFKGTPENLLAKKSIQQLHQRFLKYSTKDDAHRGKYKRRPIRFVATNPDGYQRMIFNTTEPSLVEKEMNEIINWTNQQLCSDILHPLIIIGLFVYEFLSIHPFQDGNGPLSRLLTSHLLLKSDYTFIKYVSFENLIEQNQNAYFEALKDGQINRHSYEERVDKWMLFFIQSIRTLTIELEQKHNAYKSKESYLNTRQKKIKNFIKKNQPIKLSDLDNGMPEISINTIKKDLQYLKANQIIESVGKNRGTTYAMKN
jgi:Fic family protein